MGNGHPLAGVIAPNELVSEFQTASTYFNTFGGNPVSAAAGMAVLDVLERESLQDNAKAVGAYVRRGLEKLRDTYPFVSGVRGRGLFFGIEVVDEGSGEPAPELTKRLVNSMRDRGVLLSRIGRHDNILKMRPPMVFGVDHADLLLSTLDDALGDLGAP